MTLDFQDSDLDFEESLLEGSKPDPSEEDEPEYCQICNIYHKDREACPHHWDGEPY